MEPASRTANPSPDNAIYSRLQDLKAQWIGTGFGGHDARLRLVGRLTSRPVALLFRQIASPNYETICFVRKARRHGLEPVVLEHRGDRFSVHNPYKRSLVTLPIVVGKDRHGRPITRTRKLVEHNSADGRPFASLTTDTGESLISYHHRKLACVMGADTPRFVDLSEVVASASAGARSYYADVLRLLMSQAVLFEDFIIDEQTAAFFAKVVRPAFEEVVSEGGRTPQVVRLTHGRRACLSIWNAFPPTMIDDPSWVRQGGGHVSLAS